jgi:thiol-disulfide isomerase/thioredoxin
MGPRSSIVLGLLAGTLTATLAFAALIALLPEGSATPTAPTLPPLASPSPGPSTAGSPVASGSAAPSGSVGPSDSAAPSGSVGPSDSAAPSGGGAFMIGQTAPPLIATQLGSGDEIDLSDLRGTPVWVNFMATWCPPCRDELPLMVDFAARYADEGLIVIAIDVREPESLVAPFMSSLGVTFPVGLDPDGIAQDAWGAAALPVHYWVDPGGVIRAGALGGIGPDVMAENLATILPGVDVTPP